MKKGILCILLSFLLLVPMLTSCQKEADYSEKKASIYTLYTIVDDSTTPEAIRQVELALNRIVFYRLGVILKLEMVTEDEYDKLIEDKFAEMEAYQLSKKNKKDKSSAAESSEETSEDLMTGDRILQLLEDDKDIELEAPRLDIFLVRGYDNYYKLANEGKLTALDEKLANEAKALKSSIHSTLFTAAKVNNKTYGVPVNNAIGEYTYLVFDKELLEQHKVDPNTIHTIEDLQGYLELIKTNNPDVVPLKNTNPSTSINFLSNDGFPAMINSAKEVVESYENKSLLSFLSVIARYNALGYLGEADSDDESARYAVRIESGNIDEIDKRLEDTDCEYSYSLYSNPIATNENTIDNIFCVSKYVVSNELTDVMKILTAINTDVQLMNILTYGVENEHYILTDDGQVDRLNNNYMIDPNNAGNCFITYTLKNENPDKWTNAIKQNQDAIVSPSLGYTIGLTSFDYKEKQEITDETGKATVQEIEHTIKEPDYISVINKVVDKYYPALMNGTAVEFDYKALYAEAEKAIVDEITAAQNERYEESILKPMLSESVREDIIKKHGKALYKEAEESTIGEYREKVTNTLKNRLTSSFKSEHPDASSDEIDKMVKEALTDELIDTTFNETYSEEDIKENIESTYLYMLDDEVADAASELEGTAVYNRELSKLKNSDKYKQELAEMIAKNAPRKIEKAIDGKISEIIATYTAAMKEEMNTEIQNAVDAFISENSATLGLSRDEMLAQMGYLKEDKKEDGDESAESSADSQASDSEDEEGEDEKVSLVEAYESWFEFVFEEKFVKVYYSIFGKPSAGA